MLSSITPLGQRSRGISWSRTVVAFLVGATVAGASVFGTAGLGGEVSGLATGSIGISIGVLVVAAALDTLGVRAPGPRRQVDEDWLTRYRDWVTGLGFGAQLGTGLATIVPTWGVWALLALAINHGSFVGLALGVSFGLGRTALLMATRTVTTTKQLGELMRSFARLETGASMGLLGGYGVIVTLVLIDVL